ncbi:MAG TPA: hypothetical protein VGO78_26440 [Acidimicrobiales bacterium]|nr:hypothetical protein [Acidimicrobiales bacterium]
MAYQRRPLLVDHHGGDHATLEALSDVAVAEGSQTDGATSLGLLAHLVPNVRSVLGRAEGIDGRQQAEGELAGRRVVDVLGGRDDASASLLNLVDRGSGLNPVPVESGHLVDDHQVDVSLLLEALHHGLEGRPPLDVGGGAPWLDKLPDDLNVAHLLDPPLAGTALRRDRQALRVVVGIDLAGRGHPQVEHGPTD